jgi:Tfp pilus assembly protein PilV
MGVMQGNPRRRGDRASRRVRDEAGFAMIEVIVSATLLIVLAIGTLAVLDTSTKASAMNRSRDVAAALAQADQEHMRQLPLSSIAGGYHPAPAIKTLGGVDYTVTSEGDWTRDATGVVTCSSAASSAGRGDYLKITSTVTWPGMGQTATKPVVLESIVAPGVAALGATKGAIAIKLKTAAGDGTSGIHVGSGTVGGDTDSDGCVVLNNLDEGPQTVSWSTPGYVDPDGVTNVIRPETIAAGSTAQDNGAYDRAGKVAVTFAPDAAGTAAGVSAKWPTLSVAQVGMTASNGERTFVGTGGTSSPVAAIDAVNLFPFISPYTVYAGNCPGNDPTNYTPPATFVEPSALVPPAGDMTMNVTMPSLIVKNTTGLPISKFTITAATTVSPMSPECATTFTSTQTVATGTTAKPIPVPYGIWNVCATTTGGNRPTTQLAYNTADTTGTTKRNADTLVVTGSGSC